MKTALIQKTSNGQYRISNLLLLLFSTPFIIWQMGILYFSGTSMSLFGRTPIPLEDDNTTLVIVFGYVLSILMIWIFPRKVVLMERIVLPISLISTVLMLFPFEAPVIAILFYITAFVCVFSIGTMMSAAVTQFTMGTTWRDGIMSMVIGGTIIAILQNDIFKVSFTVFIISSIVMVVAQTLFFYLIPMRIEVEFAEDKDELKMPKLLFIGIWLISGFSTLLICFASSFSESIPNGVSIVYLSAAVFAMLLFTIKKRLAKNAVRIYGGFFALSSFGFVLALLSLFLPMLRYIACVLLGFVVVLANLWIFFASASFKAFPTKYIGVIGSAMGLTLAVFHSILQDFLRDNITVLYGIYAALSVGLLLVYFFMEPYFMRIWSQDKASGNSSEKTTDAAPVSFEALSVQEQILANLILDGHSETSAARVMNISLNTQKSYRKNLYGKLGIHSKRELFELANEQKSK